MSRSAAGYERVTIQVTARNEHEGQSRIELEPYPFDLDPLPVLMPARVINLRMAKPEHFHRWWQGPLPEQIVFQLVSPE